ncbi:MAG: serine hydroxymethyltransferase, partial [Methanobrevibacter sp.]|nr:serine hydroxymethyltransferase [Methanobrevibacter sp.]
KALAGALAEQGFNVMCEDLGYTESHQVAMDVRDVKRAPILSKELEQNNIILNKNLIPGDNVNDRDDPSGIRIGTQEITRRGMKEKEMEEVAEFIWRVAEGDKVDIKDEVAEFMSGYRTIHYAFTEEEGYKFIEHI